MKRSIGVILLSVLVAVMSMIQSCSEGESHKQVIEGSSSLEQMDKDSMSMINNGAIMVIDTNVQVGEYFAFVNRLSNQMDSILGFAMDDYLLVHKNPWILDRLMDLDYYVAKSNGRIIENQPQEVLLFQGDSLRLPTKTEAASFKNWQQGLHLKLNIPAFELQVKHHDRILRKISVRVGRNDTTYLSMAGRTVDLRTRTGRGAIVRIERNAQFINPKNNRPYYSTLRDDGVRTKLPIAPWLEPELDGIRHGQLIHPTTNPVTLGKAYSNGCIGLGEADAWYVYYHAPIGTPIDFRYDLWEVNEAGDTLRYPNIYPSWEKKYQWLCSG